jgi:hypothetical protein
MISTFKSKLIFFSRSNTIIGGHCPVCTSPDGRLIKVFMHNIFYMYSGDAYGVRLLLKGGLKIIHLGGFIPKMLTFEFKYFLRDHI